MSSCIQWQGRIAVTGYGTLGRRLAHRIAYEQAFGPIPKGLSIDHTCHNEAASQGLCQGGPCQHRSCVNPNHLTAVSKGQNTLTSPLTIAAQKASQTECVNGHGFTPENTYRRPDNGVRMCRECRRLANRGRTRMVLADGRQVRRRSTP